MIFSASEMASAIAASSAGDDVASSCVIFRDTRMLAAIRIVRLRPSSIGCHRALEGLSSNGATINTPLPTAAAHPQKHKGPTAAGRKRLSELMKKRSAERRKKASAKK
jgi:hypothetical protein